VKRVSLIKFVNDQIENYVEDTSLNDCFIYIEEMFFMVLEKKIKKIATALKIWKHGFFFSVDRQNTGEIKICSC